LRFFGKHARQLDDARTWVPDMLTEKSIQLSGEIPGAELGILKNCGHVPQEECPDQFMTSIHAFLEGPY
jgi:pimeloyl-ACP methyl ester carboxylesterase